MRAPAGGNRRERGERHAHSLDELTQRRVEHERGLGNGLVNRYPRSLCALDEMPAADERTTEHNAGGQVKAELQRGLPGSD